MTSARTGMEPISSQMPSSLARPEKCGTPGCASSGGVLASDRARFGSIRVVFSGVITSRAPAPTAARISALFADPRVAQDLKPREPSDSWKDED